jgi:hypothetical protein
VVQKLGSNDVASTKRCGHRGDITSRRSLLRPAACGRCDGPGAKCIPTIDFGTVFSGGYAGQLQVVVGSCGVVVVSTTSSLFSALPIHECIGPLMMLRPVDRHMRGHEARVMMRHRLMTSTLAPSRGNPNRVCDYIRQAHTARSTAPARSAAASQACPSKTSQRRAGKILWMTRVIHGQLCPAVPPSDTLDFAASTHARSVARD